MAHHGDARHRSSPLVRALAGAASLVALAGCSNGANSSGGSAGDTGHADAGCASPSSARPAEIALMPAGLSFDKIGTVTHVANAKGHLILQAVTTKPLDEVTVLIQDAVTAVGYRPGGMDNEGDEAEVFFTTGSYAAGQARLERAECEGRWDIDLDLDLIGGKATPSAPASTMTPR
jgi:hypothetical protein